MVQGLGYNKRGIIRVSSRTKALATFAFFTIAVISSNLIICTVH